jgi:hypothetical protein
MTIELVRFKISELDQLYSKLDTIDYEYAANNISYIDYMIEKTKTEEQLNKIFNLN